MECGTCTRIVLLFYSLALCQSTIHLLPLPPPISVCLLVTSLLCIPPFSVAYRRLDDAESPNTIIHSLNCIIFFEQLPGDLPSVFPNFKSKPIYLLPAQIISRVPQRLVAPLSHHG